MSKKENTPKLAERLKHKIFFENADQDFMFQLFLSYHRYGGSAIGELFNVARRVDPKDPVSWKDEFVKEANKIEKLAEDCFVKGHRVSASDAFLRAYTYYRSAFCASYPGEEDFETIYHKTTSCYKKALNLKPFPVEWVDIEYKGYKFPGCFLKPDDSNKKRSTLIVHNGGESHAEDHYFIVGQAAIDRGYNVFMWDGPYDVGCRFHNPGLTVKNFDRNDLEGTYKEVFDYLISRPDVDADRMVVTGESYGGAKTLVHACSENRFAAVVPNSPLYSVPLLFNANSLSAFRGSAEESAKTIGKLPFFAKVTLERVIWSHGFDTLVDWIPMAEKQLVTDSQKITCAFLAMCAESEGPELKRQAQYVYDHVSSTVKDIKRGTVEDGADLHVQINNLALGQQMMFDWLDEVLDYQD